MRNSEEILNELRPISPLIASLEKVNLCTVPEGYFEGLEVRITRWVWYNDPGTVHDHGRTGNQQIPEGYFDQLSKSILSRIRAQESIPHSPNFDPELPEILQSLRNSSVFEVPEGFFQQFSERVLEKIHENDLEVKTQREDFEFPEILSGLRNVNVFKVPVGYFEQLSGQVFEGVHPEAVTDQSILDKSDEIGPLLTELKNRNVFTVPNRYFAQLPKNILSAVSHRSAGKVIVMTHRKGWIRYAVAAALAGIVTMLSVQYFINQHAEESAAATAQMMAKLPSYVKESLKYKNEEDLNAGIAQLSDAEIIKYLEKNGNIMDNELLMSNTDESGLPSQTDYLKDSSTLNNYLDQINNIQVKNATP